MKHIIIMKHILYINDSISGSGSVCKGPNNKSPNSILGVNKPGASISAGGGRYVDISRSVNGDIAIGVD